MLGRGALRSKQMSSTSFVAGAAIAGAGAYYAYRYSTSSKPGVPSKTFGAGPAFASLRLNSVETVNHNTKKLRFELPEENALSGLSLTSAVLTFSRPEGQFFPVIRPYTPISDLDQPGFIELLVKHYPNGKASTHIHSLNPGQKLFFVAAIKGFPWTPNKYSHITMIAGGAGITPMFQLIQGILKNPEDKTRITLVFGVNSDEDILFKDIFSKYESTFPGRFKVVYTVSKPVENSPYPKGYVTKELLEKVITKEKDNDTKVFVCGPPAMEEAIAGKKGILEQLGYTKDQVYKF